MTCVVTDSESDLVERGQERTDGARVEGSEPTLCEGDPWERTGGGVRGRGSDPTPVTVCQDLGTDTSPDSVPDSNS